MIQQVFYCVVKLDSETSYRLSMVTNINRLLYRRCELFHTFLEKYFLLRESIWLLAIVHIILSFSLLKNNLIYSTKII